MGKLKKYFPLCLWIPVIGIFFMDLFVAYLYDVNVPLDLWKLIWVPYQVLSIAAVMYYIVLT